MDRTTKYRLRRSRYWREIEAFFGQLPPELYRQGVLLRHDLATAYTDSGQFEDLLGREADYALLDFHFWLLDDWAVPDGEARTQLEKHLFSAMVLMFSAAYIRESILDEDTNFDSRYHALEQALTHSAHDHLSQLFSDDSPFWGYYQAFTNDYARALSHTNLRPGSDPASDNTIGSQTNRLAFAKIPVVAVALHLGQPHVARLPQLISLLTYLNTAIQFQREMASLRRDLRCGCLTYPIAQTMLRMGMTTLKSVTPEQILGAMALTGTISHIASENIQRLEFAQALAEELGLPTFNTYLQTVIDQLQEISQLFSLRGHPDAALSARPRFAVVPPTSSLTLAIEMAEGYLLSDRTWHESWEVQRRGMLGVNELVGRAFAPGLVVEALCNYRVDMAEQVDLVFRALAENNFRYYPHPQVPPDADDLGLALRLFRYSNRKDSHWQQLQQPLQWMAANIAESGKIACWFTQGVAGLEAGSTILWGNACATVEANLLLGLIAYDQNAYGTIIERSAAQWLERWIASGLGTNTLYAPHYALWVVLELLDRLSAWPNPAWRPNRISEAYERCRQHWQTYTEHVTTPQAAAFLTLISLRESASFVSSDAFDPAWIQLVLKNQRYDGSWAGEPLFVTPTRGEVAAWYSSNSVTTAYVWQALKAYAHRQTNSA